MRKGWRLATRASRSKTHGFPLGLRSGPGLEGTRHGEAGGAAHPGGEVLVLPGHDDDGEVVGESALDVDESVISDLRELRREVDAALLIRMHELTDISIAGLRNILGDRRRKARFAAEENQPKPADDDAQRDTQEHDAKPARPREIDRKEVDHQQPADPDPDDPVSP